ncbi:MAG: hypothetical protein NW200_03750 [Hyphomonadaceae bacterium]|nr:hypothetical protein [Hyphomonadaceae bacterium]
MRFGLAIAAMGVAVVASSGVAHAQSSLAERSATAAEVPWYERFTYSSGGETTPSWSTVNPRDPSAPVASARWGFTVNVGEEERLRTAEGIATGRVGESALGAFYRFSPRVRVGGQVSVAPQPVTPGVTGREQSEDSAGVKLESAFRF